MILTRRRFLGSAVVVLFAPRRVFRKMSAFQADAFTTAFQV
jgi:hypothetical protein